MEEKLIESLEGGILPDNINICDRTYDNFKLGISSFIIDILIF